MKSARFHGEICWISLWNLLDFMKYGRFHDAKWAKDQWSYFYTKWFYFLSGAQCFANGSSRSLWTSYEVHVKFPSVKNCFYDIWSYFHALPITCHGHDHVKISQATIKKIFTKTFNFKCHDSHVQKKKSCNNYNRLHLIGTQNVQKFCSNYPVVEICAN